MEPRVKKTMLYKTGVEYGDYTINHIIGCSHGCKYPCYAYLMAHRFGKAKNIEEWEKFQICENVLMILSQELKKMHHKIKSVQLCFSTDPFMFNHPEVAELSIKIIRAINEYNIPCFILTKGILPKELETLSKINYYGITFVSKSDKFIEEYEPHTAPINQRISALKYLHFKGCNTWVSMEPYPTPNIIDQKLEDILEEVKFVDKLVFGRLNYNKKVSEYKSFKSFYNDCTRTVVEFCKHNKIEHHIKEGTFTDKI